MGQVRNKGTSEPVGIHGASLENSPQETSSEFSFLLFTWQHNGLSTLLN